MLRKHTLALAAAVMAFAAHGASAANQCLSKPEMMDVARMASVMGIGAALQRCGACLAERYKPTLDRYEASHLLQDFRVAEAALRGNAKADYADEIVRQAARNLAYDLSGTCTACMKAADTIDGLSTADGRTRLYETQTEKVAKLPEARSCP